MYQLFMAKKFKVSAQGQKNFPKMFQVKLCKIRSSGKSRQEKT